MLHGLVVCMCTSTVHNNLLCTHTHTSLPTPPLGSTTESSRAQRHIQFTPVSSPATIQPSRPSSFASLSWRQRLSVRLQRTATAILHTHSHAFRIFWGRAVAIPTPSLSHRRACTSRPSHRTSGITDERTNGQFSAGEGAINVVRQRDTATALWQPGLRGSGTSCVCARIKCEGKH